MYLPDILPLTHMRGPDGTQVRVVLEERIGNDLWVRALDPGEEDDGEPIWLNPATDRLIPFTPIAAMGLNTTATVGDVTGFLVGVPVVEVRRDDTTVWLRTLRVDEPPRSGRVRVPWGFKIEFAPGDVTIELEWIDRMALPSADGYAPLTNTLWTWLAIGPPSSQDAVRYLLAASRQLDAAHRRYQEVRRSLDDVDASAPGPLNRLAIFGIIGEIETMIVALGRAVDMALRIDTLLHISVPVPTALTRAGSTLTAIRNAYEHIEDRALGQVRGKPDPQALTIFDWKPLFEQDAITYGAERLELAALPSLFLQTRAFLKTVAAVSK